DQGDTNTALGHFLPECVAETHEPPLAGDVERLADIGLPPGYRRGEDHVAAALPQHRRQDRTHGEGCSEQIRLDHSAPASRVAAVDGALVDHAGIRVHDVD